MAIRMNARPDEVQEAIGFRDEQWHRFYWITKVEAKQLLKDHPEWGSYTSFPASDRISLLDRMNTALSIEGIPPITANVLKWRMSNLVREFRRREARLATQPSAPAEPQNPPPTLGEGERMRRLAYDPVRDQ
ncbi:hypothetical protein CC78DRAFT_548579 [Lojkania enalia]|uniref:Uncharacterized protein n=1 Tax=Lojkania enalia TaxID=147567 RepID=A0A9P4JZ52_9PLEO|nr:hypothetical protein CC78DRAFT_548579 [Didymosphaeria enalia]